MDWVDYDFGNSTACQVLPDRWGIGWVSGQDDGTSQIKVNPTYFPDHHCHPVVLSDFS